MSKLQVATSINGEAVEFLCEPQQTLLEVLIADPVESGLTVFPVVEVAEQFSFHLERLKFRGHF